MSQALINRLFNFEANNRKNRIGKQKNLTNVEVNIPVVIKDIVTKEKEIIDFLFTLGCYKGERVTVISVLADNYIIHVKDVRYSIDSDLARAILV